MDDLADTAGLRPEANIMPVWIIGQYGIWIQERTILLLEDKLAILAGTRPVHQPTGLIGCIIELINTKLLGHPAGNRLVLLRADLPGQRDDQSNPLCLRLMLVR